MLYNRQFFLYFIHFITISLSIIFIPSLAYDYEKQNFFDKEANFTITACQDYINKHGTTKLHKAIQEYEKQCILLQQKGDLNALANEIARLYIRISKIFNKNKRQDKICFAIVKKIYLDPITTVLHTIAHAPLELACNELEELKIQLLDQVKKKPITPAQWSIEQYGFDLVTAARNCYTSRNDYIDLTQYQSTFSDDLKHILSIIQYKSLPIAHAEFIHLKKQITDCLDSQYIIDPMAQKNFIIKSFNCDVIELAHNIYKGRLDHKNLVNFSRPINIQESIINILNDYGYDHASRANKIHYLAEIVFNNAKLCNLDIAPVLKSRISEALNIIQKPCDNNEFTFNITLINNILSDIQEKVYGIFNAKPIISNRSPERFTQEIKTFLARSNSAI